jgi:UDP-4-amino-4,6-dideoxy-N-acetyl-beta-L-altrosamine N-acetyltransferase
MSYDLVLRRLREDDRWRILDWRNQDYVRAVSINSASIDRTSHSTWFDRALLNQRELFLIVEWKQKPVGVVRIESWDSEQRLGSWGCHLGELDVPPGLGAALPLLGLGHGFDRLGARKMHAVVLETNSNMLGIHRRLKLQQEGRLERNVLREDGTEVDEIVFGIHESEWPAFKAKAISLFPSTFRAEFQTCLDSQLID